MGKIRDSLEEYKNIFIEYGPYLLFIVVTGLWAVVTITHGEEKYAFAAMFAFSLCLFIVLALIRLHRNIDNIRKIQSWLIDATNWNVERIKAHGLCVLPDDIEPPSTATPTRRWPWGSHHTELLGHLEAAARKFWTLYDSDDPSTAPTNEMVSDWLHKERGVSKEKAKAIASILRPDGLPTGPRR